MFGGWRGRENAPAPWLALLPRLVRSQRVADEAAGPFVPRFVLEARWGWLKRAIANAFLSAPGSEALLACLTAVLRAAAAERRRWRADLEWLTPRHEA